MDAPAAVGHAAAVRLAVIVAVLAAACQTGTSSPPATGSGRPPSPATVGQPKTGPAAAPGAAVVAMLTKDEAEDLCTAFERSGAATRHALAALRAGLPVVTTRALAARLDLLTVARMVRVPIVPVIARRRGPRPPEVRVVVCPPLYPLAGEAHAGALARALDVTATSRPADSW